MTDGQRILVVEDEWLIAEATQAVLTESGYVVVGPVPSVGEALALIASQPIDAAVLDVQLVREMSFPIAEALIERQVPFLFLSGFTLADLPERFRVFTLLRKPAGADMLVAQLECLGVRVAG